MLTRVKTEQEIIAMRNAGKILASVLSTLKHSVKPGMTTKDLALIAKSELKGTGGIPSFLGYQGFPDVLCVSVNEEVVHGIPGDRKINDGDIVSMDFGVTYDDMICDAAISVVVGNISNPKHARLVRDTEAALSKGINVLKNGCRVGDIASAIESSIGKQYGIVRDLVGHGVGHQLHEEPNIPNYGSPGTGMKLLSGMTIAIEPMVTMGSHKVHTDIDGWTVKTVDDSLAAHFEHTVLITDNGSEILTAL
ncbi:type I methionyl aminopeptidase [Candidatus Saccharibacteria bacterium]|nr:type I methionyl aminopeptidase [Candidatus Saccharibacteria bacterium]